MPHFGSFFDFLSSPLLHGIEHRSWWIRSWKQKKRIKKNSVLILSTSRSFPLLLFSNFLVLMMQIAELLELRIVPVAIEVD